MQLSITLVLIILTVITSIGAFNKPAMMDDLLFYGPAIQNRNQYYRFFTHGFIHADWAHLIFNMYALWSFGEGLEKVFSFDCVFGQWHKIFFLVLYLTALFMASFPDYIKYKDSYHFKSLGASGAVSAVIFSMILFFPQSDVGLLFLPVRVPGWIFAIVYLGITIYLDKRGDSRINHSAHFWGAAYGMLLTVLYCQFFASSFNLWENFQHQLKSTSDELVLLCQ